MHFSHKIYLLSIWLRVSTVMSLSTILSSVNHSLGQEAEIAIFHFLDVIHFNNRTLLKTNCKQAAREQP